MKILFVGDVVLSDRTYSGTLVSSEFHELIAKHDIACCNLEGCIAKNEFRPLNKRGPNIRNGFLTPERLKESGFNMVTLANNHILDYGAKGLAYTLQALEPDFYFLGAGMGKRSAYKLQKVTQDNITVGFISVAEKEFGSGRAGQAECAWMLDQKSWSLIRQAREDCDYFFVICHCGAEELILPLPEVKELYRTFIDLGATAVIGHHPHVIQGSEEYRGKKIFYSLGNFAFDLEDGKSAYNPLGLCISVDIEKERADYHVYITEYTEGEVKINETCEDFRNANMILASEKQYRDYVERFCMTAYQNEFRQYYAAILGLDISDKENISKFAYHRLQNDAILWDDLFVYHNIAIETNRWICERAIRALEKNKREGQ